MNRIRTKRNFKSLQLDVSAQPLSPQEPDPVSMRLPPAATKPAAGGIKKRPPPMNLRPKAPADPSAGDSVPGDGILTVASGPTSAPPSGTMSASAKRMTYHTTLSNKLASLDMNAAVKYDLRDEELKDLNELGQGNGGSVKKVEHVPTHTIMAKKVIYIALRLSLCLLGSLVRSSLSTRSRLCESRFCASCRSCTTAIRNISSHSTARSCLIPTFASAWSLWTRVRSMASTNA
jgi:hypothetical protein